MASDWRETTVGAVANTVTKGTTPTTLGFSFQEAGVRFVKVESIGPDGALLPEKMTFISSEADAALARSRLQKDDVLFTIAGTIGRVALVPSWILPANTNQAVAIIRPDPRVVLPRFLKYVVSDRGFLRHASTRVVQGVQANFSLGELKAGKFFLPSPQEQSRVCEMLGALDDRIELLRQTNATLEAVAQALFKSWFVDFDPVRAMADGREPEGMDNATAALFPSEFEESELGLTPRGWTIARLEEHVEAERGLSYKGAGLADQESGLPLHNLNSVLEGGGYKYEGIKFYKGDFKERHFAQAGDVVVANTEQGHHHRLIGFPAIVPRRFQRGLFSHHLYRVRIRDGSPITRHWIYRALMVPRVRDQIVGCANGSTVNMLKPAGLEIPRFVLPPGPLCERFEELAVALHARMETNVDFANDLAALRDTLLPRLISGKLRLTEPDFRVAKSSE